MKLLIVYASAGSGHRQAAESAYNYFKEKSPGLDLKIIDALDKTPFLFKNIYSYGYLFLASHALWAWRLGFWLTSIKRLRPLNRILVFLINWLNAREFADFLVQESPDYIIATHFFPSQVASRLKEARKINSKLITVITDFGVHPFWVSDRVDVYIAASGFTKRQLLLEGIKENRIRESGIPVHPKYLAKYDRDILSAKLSVARNKFTVLITTGSFAIGPVEELAGLLCKEAQILVVCANNKRLYGRLKYKNYPGVKIFGFIDYVQELMAASDIIICKPGGLTISEALLMELAPVFISPIPGQETENMKALKEYGIGRYAKCVRDIREIVLDYKAHPEKLERIKANIREIKKSNTLEELLDVIR